MIELARRNHPGLGFEVGSMTEPLAESVGGMIAWWSLIHVPDDGARGVRALPTRCGRTGC